MLSQEGNKQHPVQMVSGGLAFHSDCLRNSSAGDTPVVEWGVLLYVSKNLISF